MISNQMVPRLNELHNRAAQLKITLSKHVTHAKSRPNEDYSKTVTQNEQEINDLESRWLAIWHEEHFLALNYRMDIAVREVERWSSVLQRESKVG